MMNGNPGRNRDHPGGRTAVQQSGNPRHIGMGQAKIVHLTSVHVPSDNRIFHKQCKAAVAAGYEVVLIAAHARDEVRGGVRIRSVRRPRSRLARIFTTVPAIAKAAVQERADLYQFHDPELIPVGLMLRMFGRRVLYDIHEDYTASIAQKRYLPRPMRRVLALLVGWAESVATSCFDVILAEKYYQRRFPQGTLVLNYPILEQFRHIVHGTTIREPPRLLYTGDVSIDRGASHHVGILHSVPDIEVFIVGRCTREMADALRARAGQHADRLHIVGEGRFVPFDEIMQHYKRGGWLAGLAIFPWTPHYEQKELTKFFEYMAAGLPVLCSDFPCWKRLVEGHGVGMCVDPENPMSVAGAISYLTNHPDEVRAMGIRGTAAASKFSWANQAQRLISLYREALRPDDSQRRAASSVRG